MSQEKAWQVQNQRQITIAIKIWTSIKAIYIICAVKVAVILMILNMFNNAKLMFILIRAVVFIPNMSKFKLAYINVPILLFLECF